MNKSDDVEGKGDAVTGATLGTGVGTAQSLSQWTAACFSARDAASEMELQELIQEAAEAAKSDFDATSANIWADGYVFPDNYVDSDMRCLQAAQLDFPVMVRRRLKQLSGDRLSAERVGRLRSDNPERVLMGDLVSGMRVHLPVGFTPKGNQPRTPLRSTYELVSPAVNKMLGALIEQRLAFLLPLSVAQEHVPNLHICKAHWTTKKGKASERPFVDGTPLNTDDTAEAANLYYGQIRHPTIEDIAVMVQEFWVEAKKHNPSLRYADLRMWKMDLKGAYTLLSFRPEDVGLFAMLLTGDIVYFQLAGIFGWSGTPAAFQVVTRAISWELKHALQSHTVMYVDDIIGIGFAEDIVADLSITQRICTDLLGSGAVADDKTESRRRIDVIGYVIDLDIERVLISRKNFLTALHGYLTTDITARVNLRTTQRLASWGTRYGKICRVMRPFCGALHRATWGRTNPHALYVLPTESAIAIQCWRAMLCMVRFRETEFTRAMKSFSTASPTMVAEFDASLSGAGIIWYTRDDGAEVAVGVSAIDLTFLDFSEDSSYQNLAEFI